MLAAASSWVGQASLWGMCAIIPSGSLRASWAHSHPNSGCFTLSLPPSCWSWHPFPTLLTVVGASPCWDCGCCNPHPPPGHQTPPRKGLLMLSILNSSNPLLIQLLDELKAAPLLAPPPEYPVRAVTPWLGASWPAGPSLIRISEPNSVLEVFVARRSGFFGVGWLANRPYSSQSFAEKLLGRS